MGRLYLSLPTFPLIVEHPALRWESMSLASPRDLLTVWDRLPSAVRIDLVHAGVSRGAFEAQLVRDYHAILRTEYRRHRQGDAS